MITNKGKELIARYMAGYSANWAGALEFGVGSTAVTVNDTSLEFPFVRVDVDYADYDPVNYTVTVRGTLPSSDIGEFHEVGLFSDGDFPTGQAGHQLLLDYSGNDTVYAPTNASIVTANARVGSTAYLLSAPAAGSASLRGFLPGADLNVYTGNDTLNLAYHYTNTGGTPTVNIRFESTLTDYFLHSFTPSAGYNIEVASRDSLSQTGSPSWDTVNAVYVEVTDQADVTLDGLMVEDTINIGTYGMVAREILSPALVKSEGVTTEVTFTVTLAF